MRYHYCAQLTEKVRLKLIHLSFQTNALKTMKVYCNRQNFHRHTTSPVGLGGIVFPACVWFR